MKRRSLHIMLLFLLSMAGLQSKAQDWVMPEFPSSMEPAHGLHVILLRASAIFKLDIALGLSSVAP